MSQPEPVIITTPTAISAVVEAAVARGLTHLTARPDPEEKARPEFGWVSNKEAMQMLGLSRPTLARYRADGTLPYAKWGSTVYYRLSDLEEILAARMVNRASTRDGQLGTIREAHT